MPRWPGFFLVLMSFATMAEARDITGQVAYRERIALAEDAQLVVDLRDARGVVAQARIETGGRQVPLPFLLVAPDARDYTLQAAIFVGGRAEWQTEPVPVPEGEAALDLGLVPLQRVPELGFAAPMDCGGTRIAVGFAGDRARLQAGGAWFDLAAVPSASGARYSDGAVPETAFWSKGNAGLATLRGADLPECLPVVAPLVLPLTAHGNEPGWILTVTGTDFLYEGDFGTRKVEGLLPAPEPTGSGARFSAPGGFAFAIDQSLCRDDMTGMPHPLSVTVTDGDRVLRGCGGRPGDLLAGRWVVQAIDGQALPGGAEVDMTFDMGLGRVYGRSGCNRYNGGVTLTGEGLVFGAAAGTMMACPDDQMAVEQAFLGGLTRIDRFDLAEDGALQLYAADGVVIAARR